MIFFCLCIISVSLFVGVFAEFSVSGQSGRTISPSKPTPTPQTESPNQTDKKRRQGIDSDTETYKLVFQTNFETKFSTVGKKTKIDWEETRRSWVDNFVDQLNKVGAQGYKLKSVIYRWQTLNYYPAPLAILTPDEVQHEYVWFETASDSTCHINGFEEKYDSLSKRGFHLIKYFLTNSCRSAGEGDHCKYEHLFLLEREKGDERPKKFVVARSSVRAGFKFRNEAELTEQIKEKLLDGIYPSNIFSKWEILLSQPAITEQPVTDIADVKVAMSFGLKDVKEKVNELAKQGYLLALMNQGVAVMYQDGQTVGPSTYTWLGVNDKHFDSQLAKAQEGGAIYRMVYTADEDLKGQLVFEQREVADNWRREYKVLSLEFQVVQNSALTRKPSNTDDVHIDLTPASNETLKALNSLAKEGFRVRDLFVSDIASNKVGVLLERDNLRISTKPD